jgi:hypothetical protein
MLSQAKRAKRATPWNEGEERLMQADLNAAGVRCDSSHDCEARRAAMLRLSLLYRWQRAIAAGLEMGFRLADINAQFATHVEATYRMCVTVRQLSAWRRRYESGGIVALVDGFRPDGIPAASASRREALPGHAQLMPPAKARAMAEGLAGKGVALADGAEAVRRLAVVLRWERIYIGAACLGFSRKQCLRSFLDTMVRRYGQSLSRATLFNWQRAYHKNELIGLVDGRKHRSRD